jgi:hypothetical protein
MRGKIVGHGDRTKYFLDNRQVSREEFDTAFPRVQDAQEDAPVGNRPWTRAIASDALAVHPSQLDEVRERNRKQGLEVDYAPDGRPLLKDRDQRKRLLRIEGVHDRDGGYGD